MPLPPVSPSYPLTENPVLLIGGGNLPGVSAEFSVAGFTHILLFFRYTRNAIGIGGFTFIIETSPFAIDQTVYEDWYQSALYEAGNLAPGSDVNSNIQREEFNYSSTSAADEGFIYGPIAIQGNIERMRISAVENSGGANGALSLVAMLYSLG